jgi:hypothetical protein
VISSCQWLFLAMTAAMKALIELSKIIFTNAA